MLDFPTRARRGLRVGRPRAFLNKDVAETMGIWCRAALLNDPRAIAFCRSNDLPLTRAANEGVNSAGGVLVPDDFHAAIINLRELTGAFRGNAEVVPMGRDAMPWPRRTGGLTAYFIAENTAPTESQLGLDNITLTAKKIGVLTRMSTELEEDSAADFGELVASEVAYAFARKEDDCGFNGDGSPTYGGMRGLTVLLIDGNHNAGKVTAASGHNTFGTLDATDLAATVAAIPAIALPGAKWFVSQFGFATTFCRLAAVAGGIIVMQDEITGRSYPTFLGFPVVITQALPQIATTLTGKVMLLFGDLSLAAAVGDRRVVAVRKSDHRYFDQDQIGVLGTERVDVVAHDVGDNTTAGPIVGLAAP